MSDAVTECRDLFRLAMRRLAGGVIILTAGHEGQRYGMTMTAVMSLSMDPPSLALGVNRSASIAAPLLASGRCCVNLLRASQDAFCGTFSSLPSAERFGVGEWADDAYGTPYLADAQANIFCTIGPNLDYGTHSLMIAIAERVINAVDVSPLIHLDGRYVTAG